ncbi:hypothetical protein EW146_g1947 [Bondarzewia mesenterica]|uniref:Uncharacterized protein n=1 Tax=Bondarzewia mesenterica TaxID=1095465 RepID=A0A4V3XFW6_9AGAM|nr:hypothetical protein EW146_g1947 [Bondarzewia mesenterica]
MDLNTEPVYITTQRFGPSRMSNGVVDRGGEYLAFYYVGQIAPDAVREENTGMPDEKFYVGKLFSIHEALQRLPKTEALITEIAYQLWEETVRLQAEEQEREKQKAETRRRGGGVLHGTKAY